MRRKQWNQIMNDSIDTNIPYQDDFVKKIIAESYEPSFNKNKFPVFRLAMASFALFIVSFLSFIGYKSYYTVTSSFTLDINPSVEVFMNKYDKVIDITPINDDGVLLLSSMSKSSGSVDLVLEDILATSEDLGFLSSESQTILIGISSDTDSNQTDLETRISSYFATNTYELFVIPTTQIDVEAIFTLFSTVSSPETSESPYKTDENDIQDYFNDVISADAGSNDNIVTEYYSSSYVALQDYYTVNYHISEAHFALIMMIVEIDQDYQEVSQLNILLGLTIDDLVSLYNEIK